MSLIGSIVVTTPIRDIQFYIIKAYTLFLLSLANIDILSIYFNNLTN